MPPVGSRPPFGGWRHHLPPLKRGNYGCSAACQFEFIKVTERKPYNRASPEGNKPTALAGDGNAPLLPTAPPPEGEVLAALCLDMLMRTKAVRRANFPPSGWQRNWIRRGAKRPENPVTCFPLGEVPRRRG